MRFFLESPHDELEKCNCSAHESSARMPTRGEVALWLVSRGASCTPEGAEGGCDASSRWFWLVREREGAPGRERKRERGAAAEREEGV